ncbi:MAG: mechanosensitive ion channel family protein [Lachnospiraceae bacterium]|jgi:small conductance mechanosensitive channel|nr:mechanosensitive ion channel family protein [Lachnospiraceae bacterium]
MHLEWIVSSASQQTPVLDPNAIEQFISGLPEKALRMGLRVLLALVVFLLGVQLIKLARRIVRRSLERGKVDVGVRQFTDSFLKAVLYILLVFMIAGGFGVDAASVVALLGSAGVAIGLAVQGSLSNLAGGVLILILKPFLVGDYIIEGGGKEGTVTEIQLFYTRLLTPDNRTVILPNGALANGSLVNVTADKYRRCDISVGISYQSDLQTAREALMGMLEADPAVLKDRDMRVVVDALGESAIQLIVRCWFTNEEYWDGRYRLTEGIKTVLDQAGIQIPYPQLDVHVLGHEGNKEL